MATRYTHPDGLDLAPGDSFKLRDPVLDDVISYPRGWLANATPAEIQALGFTRVDTPDPAPAPGDPLATPLTRKQLRLGLLNLGATWDAVLAYAASIPDPVQAERILIDLEDSELYHRDHPLFGTIPAAFDLTVEQINAEWAKATAY